MWLLLVTHIFICNKHNYIDLRVLAWITIVTKQTATSLLAHPGHGEASKIDAPVCDG